MRPPKASERTLRDWREVGSAISQTVYAQLAPVEEGYASLPGLAVDALTDALYALDQFDLHLAKLDGACSATGARSPVGGAYALKWDDARRVGG